MALRIWLPLNNSYENRGIDGASVTTGGVFETPGKLSAYCWRSSARISVPYTYGSTERLSVCMWIKPNSAVAWTSIFGWGNTSTRKNRVEIDANGSAGYYFFGSGDCLVASNTRITTDGLPNAVWSHFAMTADGTTVKFYINGTMVKSATQKSQVSATFDGTNTFYFGGYSDNFNGYYNDVRVYDHALSQKEVAELAKGMMVHIPFYGDGYPGIGTNIANGTNVSNSAWLAPKTINVGQYYSSLGINSNTYFGLQSGDTYTYRVKLTAPSTKGIRASVQYYTDSSTRTGPSGNTVAAGTTGYSTITATLTDATRGYTQMQLLITNADTSVTSSDPVIVEEVKLELGAVATDWSPALNSSNYSGDYTITDCSGYQRNLTISDTRPIVGNTGPRYGLSAKFPSGSYLSMTDPISPSAQEFTISVWINPSTVSGNQCIWNGRTSTSTAFSIFLISSSIRVQDSGSKDVAVGLVANTWYHIAVTWKSGGNKVLYVNGAEKYSATAGTLNKSNTLASIGASSTGSAVTNNNYFSGQMSDYRIYATALTAAQIKELYNAPISVANTGACLAEQFTEGASSISFAKTGVVSCNGISSLPGKYDPEVLIEPDGSCWAHIGHHADPTTYKFASGDPFATGVWKDDRRFLDASICNNVDKWEFLVVQKKTSGGSVERYRWSQPVNPNTANYSGTVASTITRYGTADGYNSSSYGGMYYNGGNNSYYVCNNGTSGNWYGAIGCWSDFQSGIPAYNGGGIKDGGYTDLYIRIDNVTFSSGRTGCSLDKGGKGVLSAEFVEQ